MYVFEKNSSSNEKKHDLDAATIKVYPGANSNIKNQF